MRKELAEVIVENGIVYHLGEDRFETEAYTFKDRIKCSLYDDLWIDFKEL